MQRCAAGDGKPMAKDTEGMPPSRDEGGFFVVAI